MLDNILKICALGLFIAYLSFLPVYVPDYDLITVIVIVVGFAVYDLLIRPALRSRRRN